MSNVREVFFQTLSNSSWANVGYLVAAEITGDETLKELAMLCAAHSIGGILLDKEEIANTQILIQATEKENVDWELCNRLISINRDFEHYIELVSEFYKLGEVKKVIGSGAINTRFFCCGVERVGCSAPSLRYDFMSLKLRSLCLLKSALAVADYLYG
ncbi:hypothetical protein [Providencia manganoxydans]|uniref:hypothetical protein n=1 Tax=Providencia manganoxydans TaxID=2923283 RepID=UPI0032DBDD36